VPVGVARPSRKKRRESADKNRVVTLGRVSHVGNKKLRKLSQRHLRILTLHLSGDFLNKEIAEVIGCAVSTVNRVLGDPLAQNIINDFRAGQVQELEALFPKAVEAVRAGLGQNDTKTKLLAVDRFLKMTGRDDGTKPAGTNVSITVVNARTRFVETMRQVVDVTPVKDEDNAGGAPSAPQAELERRSHESS